MENSLYPFVVMVKPVGSICNMSCRYCYYLHADNNQGKNEYVMSEEKLEVFIKNYIRCSKGPIVSFTWHGGEPTIAGLPFYKKAIELEKKYLPKGWQCWNSLQTNGLLLDDEWCQFLKEENFDVGISIDGPEWLHNLYRKDQGDNDTYERVKNAVILLQKYGIQPDLLCTVTQDTAENPLEVYKSLRDLNTGWMQFIPIVRFDASGNLTSDSVKPQTYGNFLKTIFDYWLYHDFGTCQVQLFSEVAGVLVGQKPSLCWISETCGNVLVVEQDGSIYACDHFVNQEHKIGNVSNDLFIDVVEDNVKNFGNKKKENLTNECLNCNWLAMCNGGCLKDRFSTSIDGQSGQYYLCEGLKMFFQYAEKPLKRALQLSSLGYERNEIGQILISEKKALWKNVNRNDKCPCGSGKKAKKCCWHLKDN